MRSSRSSRCSSSRKLEGVEVDGVDKLHKDMREPERERERERERCSRRGKRKGVGMEEGSGLSVSTSAGVGLLKSRFGATSEERAVEVGNYAHSRTNHAFVHTHIDRSRS